MCNLQFCGMPLHSVGRRRFKDLLPCGEYRGDVWGVVQRKSEASQLKSAISRP